MSDVANEVVAAAEEVAPNAPVVEVASAVLETVKDPSPSNILSDIELALSLVKQLKNALSGAHPSVLALIKLLF